MVKGCLYIILIVIIIGLIAQYSQIAGIILGSIFVLYVLFVIYCLKSGKKNNANSHNKNENTNRFASSNITEESERKVRNEDVKFHETKSIIESHAKMVEASHRMEEIAKKVITGGKESNQNDKAMIPQREFVQDYDNEDKILFGRIKNVIRKENLSVTILHSTAFVNILNDYHVFQTVEQHAFSKILKLGIEQELFTQIFKSNFRINDTRIIIERFALSNGLDKNMAQTAITLVCYSFTNEELPNNQSRNKIEDKIHQETFHPWDPLLEQCAEYAISVRIISTSQIQRNFMIGYNRASRIMEQLEELGIIKRIKGQAYRLVQINDKNKIKDIINKRPGTETKV